MKTTGTWMGKRTVAFFSSEFVGKFSTNIRHVSFELVPYGTDRYGNDRYRAVKIRDAEHDGAPAAKYAAVKLRPGNTPADRTVNGYCHFLFHKLFFAGRSIGDSGCPETLREAFLDAKDEWIKSYMRCTDPLVQSRILNLMSLASGDLGDRYYQLANQRIEDYREGRARLPDNIGYSLRDCTKTRELGLLEHIQVLRDEKVVCILSKAVWGNPDFIRNFPIKAAFQYFDAAVDYTGKLIGRWEKARAAAGRNKAEQDLRMCFEYALGVFRMRTLGGDGVKWKLSMNDEAVRRLYGLVERAIEDQIPVRTFLNLSISDKKKQYEHIPDLLYALLVYITGREEGDTIQISGIDFDEE